MSGWWIAAFVGLCALVVALAVAMIVMLRMIGVLLVRVGPTYARGFTEMPWKRLPADELRAIDGRSIVIEQETLLIFVSPTCGACRAVIPALRSFGHGPPVPIIVVVAGDGDDAAKWAARARIPAATVIASDDQPERVTDGITSPYGVLLDAGGRVAHHGIVNDREMIESLLERHRGALVTA
jgi:methylamine dehydrogenase accessory protein MauD